MLPTRTVLGRLATLFANNLAMLETTAPNGVIMKFVKSDFTEGPELTRADLTFNADSEGTIKLTVTDTAPLPFFDAITGALGWEFRVDPGVYTFVGATVVTPFTIFGVALLNAAGDTLLAVKRLASPVDIVAAGYAFHVPRIEFLFPLNIVR